MTTSITNIHHVQLSEPINEEPTSSHEYTKQLCEQLHAPDMVNHPRGCISEQSYDRSYCPLKQESTRQPPYHEDESTSSSTECEARHQSTPYIEGIFSNTLDSDIYGDGVNTSKCDMATASTLSTSLDASMRQPQEHRPERSDLRLPNVLTSDLRSCTRSECVLETNSSNLNNSSNETDHQLKRYPDGTDEPLNGDENDDGGEYITYWHQEKKCDCKLLLNTSILLNQPPPHFSLTKHHVMQDFKGKRMYLFLDYDGTLTPIVNNPWEARLAPGVRQLLFDLASDTKDLVTVGIVTGRALTSVKNFVQIVASENLNFIYAASHGFHIEAAGKLLHHRVGSKFIPTLKRATAVLERNLNHIKGVMLEDNEFAVSIHYRNAAEDAESIVEAIIQKTLIDYPELKMTRGKKVFELRINVVWNKGRAVFWLLNAMQVDPFDSSIRVVYIGDDLTDEDAFRAVRNLNNSLTILVSDNPSFRPTAATCFVQNPAEVAGLLKMFLGIVRDTEV